MSVFPENDDYQIVWLIRRLFRALAQKSDQSLESSGISAADRAVMEFLYPDRALSVPEIAERYDVSRQHVQVTVNTLIEKELIVTRENPRHKRSPHLSLSARGRRVFAHILDNDKQTVKRLFSGISTRNQQITRESLQLLLDELRKG